jgi:hypothetical protein
MAAAATRLGDVLTRRGSTARWFDAMLSREDATGVPPFEPQCPETEPLGTRDGVERGPVIERDAPVALGE